MSIYDSETAVRSFDEPYIPEDQLQTQWAEFIELKKIITAQFAIKKSPVRILDIGIGSARILKHLAPIPEIWNMVENYHGIDNAEACLKLSAKVAEELQITNKIELQYLQADDLKTLNLNFDIIMTTWFTAGNFYPADFDFHSYMPGSLELHKNERFTDIFSNAYNLLNTEGKIVLGACYIDNQVTRIRQENFYRHLGMHVITNDKDSFTATKQGFWSQRFTKQRMIDYCKFAEVNKISFTDLDTYQFAMQVVIEK